MLKLHDRKDVYTKMVDKYKVKKYVSDSFESFDPEEYNKKMGGLIGLSKLSGEER